MKNKVDRILNTEYYAYRKEQIVNEILSAFTGVSDTLRDEFKKNPFISYSDNKTILLFGNYLIRNLKS